MPDKCTSECVHPPAGAAALSRWRARLVKAAPSERLAERRRHKRRGVRLNWGKALDISDRFLCDCVVLNRSQGGARLRLARKIGLPAAFHFFDDSESALFAGAVVWRKGDVIGCRLTPEPLRGKGEVVKRMSGRYYAL